MSDRPIHNLGGINENDAWTIKDLLKCGLRFVAIATVGVLGIAAGAEHGLAAGLGVVTGAGVVGTVVDIIGETIIGK